MNLNIGGITIDSTEPRQLAEFWTKALDMEVVFDADGWYVQLRSRGDGPQVCVGLQKVPEKRVGKNRVHLDLATDDRLGELKRLESLGATVGETHEMPDFAWTVLQDPEGNEFCVGSQHD
ncbi:MAG: VOC family protein [Actinomycetota bacterium]|nr:VOC family protein [Actinomycetota bacterium]